LTWVTKGDPLYGGCDYFPASVGRFPSLTPRPRFRREPKNEDTTPLLVDGVEAWLVGGLVFRAG